MAGAPQVRIAMAWVSLHGGRNTLGFALYVCSQLSDKYVGGDRCAAGGWRPEGRASVGNWWGVG